MPIVTLEGVRLAAVAAEVPEDVAENEARLAEATGIRRRRLAAPGVTSLDLCVAAARRLFGEAGVRPADIRGVVSVSFTPARTFPGNAFQAQARLGLPKAIPAFDVAMACSGYVYGLYLAGTLARALGGPVLLLDGDVQSSVLADGDAATAPILADAGTASLVVPSEGGRWQFAFLTDGAGGEALTLPPGGTIAMDGFAVFRFVAADVSALLKRFLAETRTDVASLAAFVPHQANVYMVRQLAKAIGVPAEKLRVSADEVGNPASASIPVTLARTGCPCENILLAGFGAGLSAAVAKI